MKLCSTGLGIYMSELRKALIVITLLFLAREEEKCFRNFGLEKSWNSLGNACTVVACC